MNLNATKCITHAMEPFTIKTKVGKAKSTGDSLKSTIPMSVIRVMGLKEGDNLVWHCFEENGRVVLKLEKE